MTMLLTERDTGDGRLVTVCDAVDLGERYDNGTASLTVDPDFYAGEEAVEADAEAVAAALSRATVANLVGEEAVGTAVEHGFVDESNVMEFDGTRHAQYLLL